MTYPGDDMAEMFPRPPGSTSTVGGGQGVYVKLPRRVAAAEEPSLPAPPVVTSVNPFVAPEAGGVAVTITGIFGGAVDSVRFAAASASSVVRVNGTTITCVTPAGTGFVTVTVRDVHGQEGFLLNGFSYEAGGGPPDP